MAAGIVGYIHTRINDQPKVASCLCEYSSQILFFLFLTHALCVMKIVPHILLKDRSEFTWVAGNYAMSVYPGDYVVSRGYEWRQRKHWRVTQFQAGWQAWLCLEEATNMNQDLANRFFGHR